MSKVLNLDAVLQAAPPGYVEDVVAEPQYSRVAMECFSNHVGFSGFKVGFPLSIWRGHIVQHVPALIVEPVLLFGHVLQATGWSARIAPVTPIRSTDQLIWVDFRVPAALYTKPNANNLTCAPGVQALHGQLHG